MKFHYWLKGKTNYEFSHYGMALRKVDEDERCTELDGIVLLYVLLGEIEVEEERLLSFRILNSNYLLAFLFDGVNVGVHVRRSTLRYLYHHFSLSRRFCSALLSLKSFSTNK